MYNMYILRNSEQNTYLTDKLQYAIGRPVYVKCFVLFYLYIVL